MTSILAMDFILSMCQRVGFIPDVVQEVRPTQTMIGLVSAGKTFKPARAVQGGKTYNRARKLFPAADLPRT